MKRDLLVGIAGAVAGVLLTLFVERRIGDGASPAKTPPASRSESADWRKNIPRAVLNPDGSLEFNGKTVGPDSLFNSIFDLRSQAVVIRIEKRVGDGPAAAESLRRLRSMASSGLWVIEDEAKGTGAGFHQTLDLLGAAAK